MVGLNSHTRDKLSVIQDTLSKSRWDWNLVVDFIDPDPDQVIRDFVKWVRLLRSKSLKDLGLNSKDIKRASIPWVFATHTLRKTYRLYSLIGDCGHVDLKEFKDLAGNIFGVKASLISLTSDDRQEAVEGILDCWRRDRFIKFGEHFSFTEANRDLKISSIYFRD